VDAPPAFVEALCDDLNTPKAIAELSNLATLANTSTTPASKKEAKSILLAAGALMGVLASNPEAWFHTGADAAEIEGLVSMRVKARKTKNWAEADALRQQLLGRWVSLEDSASGTQWKFDMSGRAIERAFGEWVKQVGEARVLEQQAELGVRLDALLQYRGKTFIVEFKQQISPLENVILQMQHYGSELKSVGVVIDGHLVFAPLTAANHAASERTLGACPDLPVLVILTDGTGRERYRKELASTDN
jgi:hypothetical protein